MRDSEGFLGNVGIVKDFPTNIIKAFERANTGGSDGNGATAVANQVLDGLPPHADMFAVHFVAFDGLALYGTERACAHVQRHFFACNSLIFNRFQDIFREMKSGGRCGDTAFDARIDGLIGAFVAFLGVAVQVRRNGQFADGIEDFSERESPFRFPLKGESFIFYKPLKFNELARSHTTLSRCAKFNFFTFYL